MDSKHRIILLSLLTALGACATTDQTASISVNATSIASHDMALTLPVITIGARPEWLMHDSQDYPPRDYYTRTAQADSPQAAATLACERIITLLRPEPEAEPVEQLQQKIKIAALWHNQGRYHALAVLPRQEAETFLRGRLNSLDAATKISVAKLDATDEPLEKIGLLHSVIQRQQLRAAYQKSLKQVDPLKEGRESPWDTRRWSLQMEALLKELRVIPVMDITLSNPTALTPMLEQGLKNGGMQPASPLEADYILSGKLDIEEKELTNGYTQAKGHLELTLQHKDKQIRYGMQDWAFEVTSLSAEGAKERLLNKVQQILTQDKRGTIIGIATQPTVK
ncbi:MAG: hypothetical protein HY272_08220 [Gammaproteobacteria bacterium]|nr:hypothetical protein [Gammaproteobacteria bacterium]